jgi:hypothetical protein
MRLQKLHRQPIDNIHPKLTINHLRNSGQMLWMFKEVADANGHGECILAQAHTKRQAVGGGES